MANTLLEIENPSYDDLKRTITDYQDRILEADEDEQWQSLVKRAEESEKEGMEFLSKAERRQYNTRMARLQSWKNDLEAFHKLYLSGEYLLGSVFSGSGLYRRRADEFARGLRQPGQGYVLDWALIRIREKRRGPNEVWRFLFNTLKVSLLILRAHQPYLNGEEGTFGPHLQFEEASFSDAINRRSILYKCGRSSGVTRARFSKLQSAQVCKKLNRQTGQLEDTATWEYVVAAPEGTIFAEPGDSGSFVFNVNGGVVALFWGSPGRHSSGRGYVTPIDDIFEDIKRVTHCTNVRIAP